MKKITLIVEDENGKKVTAKFTSEMVETMKDMHNTCAFEQMYNVLLDELKQMK